MGILGRHLESHGFDVYFVSYPSTQASIGSHARNLQRILHHLDHPGPIHIVGHSMGGLVTRAYLELEVDPRLRRVVTLGTPHQGADMADLLARYRLLPMLGPAAMQLVHGPAGIATKLRPNPARATGLEFGVIAGIGPDGKGFSPLIPHNNDGIVTLASALLEGATDVHLVRGVHSFLMSLISVRIVTERFLRRGYFRAADDRRSVIAIPGPAGAPTVLHIVPAAPPVALDARG
jgi:pimeloyl-ACP methyl ester carboxylesterase